MAQITSATPIQIGEIHTQYIFTITDEATNTPVNLTSANVTMVILAPLPAKGGGSQPRNVYSCTVSGDGTSASYYTVGNEFGAPGIYQLQAISVGPLGTHRSQVITQKVLPNI
jgi:hypothetical protein